MIRPDTRIRSDTRRGAVFTRRALLIGGVQTLMLGGLAARLRQVQVEEGSRYAVMAEDNSVSARLMAPPRGRILDRFGAQLAGSLINWRALLVTAYMTGWRIGSLLALRREDVDLETGFA